MAVRLRRNTHWERAIEEQVTEYNIKDVFSQKFETSDSFTGGYSGGQRRSTYDQPVVIIIDRGCGSQCEFFVASMRHHPKVTVIGVPSAGRLNFGSVGYLDMPNSGVRMHISTAKTDFYPDVIEGTGIIPELLVLQGDSVEVAKALIKSKMK
jgi:C-terminal processing protease CtpA/Prc